MLAKATGILRVKETQGWTLLSHPIESIHQYLWVSKTPMTLALHPSTHGEGLHLPWMAHPHLFSANAEETVTGVLQEQQQEAAWSGLAQTRLFFLDASDAQMAESMN